jgi:hypothetical protein
MQRNFAISCGNKSRVPLHLGTFILYHLGSTGTILHPLLGLFNGNNYQKVADPRNVVAQFIGHFCLINQATTEFADLIISGESP